MGPVEGRAVPFHFAIEASEAPPSKQLALGRLLDTTGAAAAGAAAGAGEAFCMNFIFSKVSLMPPEGDAAGAALGARGVACFLLFLEEASLLFVLRFLPMATRRSGVAEQQSALKMKPRLAARTRRGCVRPVTLLL